MTQVMIAYEKDGPRYLDLSHGIGWTSKALLQERVNAGCWYEHPETVARARRALSGVDPKLTCWGFLYRRRDFEYERVEIVDLEQLQIDGATSP